MPIITIHEIDGVPRQEYHTHVGGLMTHYPDKDIYIDGEPARNPGLAIPKGAVVTLYPWVRPTQSTPTPTRPLESSGSTIVGPHMGPGYHRPQLPALCAEQWGEEFEV